MLFFLAFWLASCNSENTLEREFGFLHKATLVDDEAPERVLKKDVYKKIKKVEIPSYVGDLRELAIDGDTIYFSDTESVYRYFNDEFDIAFTPKKGRGPMEVPQIFRFEIRNNIIAISGYPDLRLLIHDLSTGLSKLIMTQYRSDVMIDDHMNIYGENSSNISGNMFNMFSINGDSLKSFGNLFNNQAQSLDMFDFYWSYNTKHDLIFIGFMYVGYYVALTTDGEVIYSMHSLHHPGRFPVITTQGGYRFVDDGGINILRQLTTANDELHIYTAHAADKKGDYYGALVEVFDVPTGKYKFSYVLDEVLHWPILLLDDYGLVSVNQDYEMVFWERN